MSLRPERETAPSLLPHPASNLMSGQGCETAMMAMMTVEDKKNLADNGGKTQTLEELKHDSRHSQI